MFLAGESFFLSGDQAGGRPADSVSGGLLAPPDMPGGPAPKNRFEPVDRNERTSELLATLRETIDKLDRETANSGRTIVPLSIYFSDGYAKVELALATGKKDWDKRQAIAERDANREAQRALAARNRARR